MMRLTSALCVGAAIWHLASQPCHGAPQTEGTAGWIMAAVSTGNYYPATLSSGRIGVVPGCDPFQVRRIMLNAVFDKEREGGVSRMIEGIDFLTSRLTINGEPVTGGNISNWRQVLDLKEASLTTSFDFRNCAHVSYAVRALRHMPYAAMMNVEIQAREDVAVVFDNAMNLPLGLADAEISFKTLRDGKIVMPLHQASATTRYCRIPVTATSVFIFEGEAPALRKQTPKDASPTVGFETQVKSGHTLAFSLAGAICTGVDFQDPRNESERMCISLLLQKMPAVLAAHRAAWEKLWENDIIIEGDPASQLAVRFALFNLYGFSRAGSRLSVPPMGLSSQGYNGHVFWDMELWMMPPLLVMNPELARAALDYRFDRLSKARQKAENNGYRGAMFPWESDASGEEATPPFAVCGAFEQHITADVAIAAWNYFLVTQDEVWLRGSGFLLLRDIAEFWLSRVTHNTDGSCSILNVVGADEFAQNVDDDAFTNGSAIEALRCAERAAKRLGLSADPRWAEVAGRIRLHHFPDGVIREHATYQGERIKQADANLLIYPLGLITDPARIERDVEYYEPRMAAEGPAMGHSVLSVIYSRLGDPEKGFRFFEQSYLPNSRPPFGVLSESAKSNNPYFATAAGGMLQAVLFGFAGLHLTDHGLVQEQPCLPRHWSSLTIRGLGLKDGPICVRAKAGDVVPAPIRSAPANQAAATPEPGGQTTGAGAELRPMAAPAGAPAPASPSNQSKPRTLFSDDFNTDGKLGDWTDIKRVSAANVKNGHVLLANDWEKVKAEGEGIDPTTSLVYNLGEESGNFTLECKFDDFVAGENCQFEMTLLAAPGYLASIKRWSGDHQALKFEAIVDGKPVVTKENRFDRNSAILKLQYTAATGELRAFYRENTDTDYKEMEGSPIVSAGFKAGPYLAVFTCLNYAKGTPASVKLDWVKITSPVN